MNKINANTDLQRQSKRSASFLRVCLPKHKTKHTQKNFKSLFLCLFVRFSFFFFIGCPLLHLNERRNDSDRGLGLSESTCGPTVCG